MTQDIILRLFWVSELVIGGVIVLLIVFIYFLNSGQ